MFETDKYADGTQQVVAALRSQGHDLVKLKNLWGNPEYKGINSQWVDAESGRRFEVQFHTPDSWSAKQETHDAYEQINNIMTPDEERGRLRAAQVERSARVPVPPNAFEISDYDSGDNR